MITPPRFTETVLMSLGASPEYRDAVLGDMAEELEWRAGYDGERVARRWYYREALRSIPHLLGNAVRETRWRGVARIANHVVTAWILSSILAMVVGLTTISATRLLFPGGPRMTVAVAVLLTTATSVLGGYIAAWLDRDTPLVSAAAFGVTLGIAQISATLVMPPEVGGLWLLAVVPPLRVTFAIAGALLQLRRRLRSLDETAISST